MLKIFGTGFGVLTSKFEKYFRGWFVTSDIYLHWGHERVARLNVAHEIYFSFK